MTKRETKEQNERERKGSRTKREKEQDETEKEKDEGTREKGGRERKRGDRGRVNTTPRSQGHHSALSICVTSRKDIKEKKKEEKISRKEGRKE